MHCKWTKATGTKLKISVSHVPRTIAMQHKSPTACFSKGVSVQNRHARPRYWCNILLKCTLIWPILEPITLICCAKKCAVRAICSCAAHMCVPLPLPKVKQKIECCSSRSFFSCPAKFLSTSGNWNYLIYILYKQFAGVGHPNKHKSFLVDN